MWRISLEGGGTPHDYSVKFSKEFHHIILATQWDQHPVRHIALHTGGVSAAHSSSFLSATIRSRIIADILCSTKTMINKSHGKYNTMKNWAAQLISYVLLLLLRLCTLLYNREENYS